jgi:hypothetical protein
MSFPPSVGVSYLFATGIKRTFCEAEVLAYTRMQLFRKGTNMYLKSSCSGIGRRVVLYLHLQGLTVSIELCLLLVSG